MGVKLKERINGDGTTTLYLAIYYSNHNPKRWWEFLTSIKLINRPKNPAERQKNKENKALANKIASERARELEAKDYNINTENSRLIIVIDWMKGFAKKYKEDDIRVIKGVAKNFKKADFRVVDGVVKRFETFLTKNNNAGLLMRDFNKSVVEEFKEELSNTCKGEGARSYFNRFKKIVRAAYDKEFLARNPCEGVEAPEGSAEEKDTLTSEEIQLIAQTRSDAVEVKRAALFTSQTGVRWCDLKALTWKAVDIQKRTLIFTQSKTDRKTYGQLNQTAIALLGSPGEKNELIFDLPSSNGANKSLDLLVKRAGIDKKIRWHNLRHSYGTNLYENGAEIYTVSKLLGHSGVTHTVRYARASEKRKQEAVNNLPEINFSRIVENGSTFELVSKPKPKRTAKKPRKKAKKK